MKKYFDYTVLEDGTIYGKFGRKLKPILSKNGYHKVAIFNNGKRMEKYVHRIVAECYLSNNENKPQVNHINGVKTENSVSNLEWVTCKENVIHSYKTNLSNNFGENNGSSKLKSQQVYEIKKLYNTGDYTYRQIAEIFNVHFMTICKIVKGKMWVSQNHIEI